MCLNLACILKTLDNILTCDQPLDESVGFILWLIFVSSGLIQIILLLI